MRCHFWVGVCGVLLFGGCATAPKNTAAPVYVEAKREIEPLPVPKVVRIPVVHAAPGQARPSPLAVEPSQQEIEAEIKRQAEKPWEVVDAANAAARYEPVSEGFYNAVQVYDYAPGILYQVYTAHGRLTAIEFSPGEKVRSVALGDTVRWVIGQTESGSGNTTKEIVLVKPIRTGLATNAVITTNLRTYQLELRSFRESYMASVSWNQPGVEIARFSTAIESQQKADSSGLESNVIETALDVPALNFRYGFRVDNPKKAPAWMPVRVFDDGKKTYIQFAKEVRHRELPAFFILTGTGKPVVANFRVNGDYMIVDQVFDLAKLRMSEAGVDGETVGIERLGGR